jgi:eukaryotic-like serine/threonine-protein kinase
MEGRDARRPDNSDDQPTLAEGIAAVKSPSDTGSSSAPLTPSSGSSPTLFADPSDAPTIAEGGGSSSSARTSYPGLGDPDLLQPGTLLGQRYEILQLLGKGGMGAVYRAKDREVNRMVALKVIRPDLAGNRAILDRFKLELVLSHKVTHKNVVRIYDLGEASGIKFITMEYIEGQDLRSLIVEKKTFPPEEAVEIMRQVCRALEAAHAVGIIHRDLKPQNIMRDGEGRVVVMDFGLARLQDSNDGMTQTGAIVGTMEYMSPEQGLGKPLDERSDLFAVGLIFYELLTGIMPYKADSALASLVKRTQERAAPVSSHSAAIPRALSDIVSKCLEPKLEQRYQHVGEILTSLEAWQGKDAAATLGFPGVKTWGQTVPWPMLGGALAVLILAVVGFVFRGKIFSGSARAPAGPTSSLAIVPFRNASGDPSLDWLGASIADMLTTDVGQSSSLRTVSSDRLHQILRDLRISPDTTLDPDTLKRLAEFSNADQVISGQYAKFGDQIRIDATLQDLKQQRTVPLKVEAPNQKALLAAVDQLAKSIQQSLAVPSGAAQELQATAFTPSSKSVEAMRYYSEGSELTRQGKYLEALKKLQASVKEDDQFAFAYAKLGQTYAKLGYENDAENASRKAVDLSGSLPDPEKYRIAAIQARIAKDNQKAIDAYESLAKAAPGDTDLSFNLAELYFASGAYDHSRNLYTKLLAGDPKYVDALLGISRVEIMTGNLQSAIDYLNRALTLAIQVGNDEEKAAILHLTGVSYSQLNKPDDALRNFEASLVLERAMGDKRATAKTLDDIAGVQDLMGKADEAVRSYQEAVRLWHEIGDKRGAGGTGINLGQYYEAHGEYDKALSATKDALQLEHEIGEPADEAVCLNNIGWIHLDMARYDDALTYFQQALQLREKLNSPADIADSYYNLADTSSRIGQYDKAMADYLRAIDLWRKAGDKRGVAIASFGMGTLFEHQGRYGAALGSMEDAVKTFRELQERSNWMAEVLGGYGNALTLVGRGDEAQKNLEEALTLGKQLKSNPLTARILNYQGDRFFYGGNFKSAGPLYEQALQLASKGKDPYLVLVTKLDLARLAVKAGRSRESVAGLTSLGKDADSLGLKYASAESKLALGEALLTSKSYPRAQQELEGVVRSARDLGARALTAQAQYLLAGALRSQGKASEASSHMAEARQALDDIQKEVRNDQVVKRTDLNPIYTASAH